MIRLILSSCTVALALPGLVFGQITSTTSRNDLMTPAIANAQAQVNKILEDSGRSFRDGLMAFKANKRSDSGEKFDKAVEVFLYSTVNIQKDQKLQACYQQLIETVYRIEHPSDTQAPQIRSLSASCGWNWNDQDFKLADEVAQMVHPYSLKSATANILAAASTPLDGPTEPSAGFNTQEFEPSPLDELAKLEFATEDDLEQRRNNNQFFGRTIGGAKVVRAQAGDTVTKLATRHNANPTEVAKYNGLMPNSVLGAGREIKLPPTRNESDTATPVNRIDNLQYTRPNTAVPKTVRVLPPIGPKPKLTKDGKVLAVISYFNESLHDPYSMRYVRWSKLFEVTFRGARYWAVSVKFRAKNLMGAYVLSEQVFLIRNNQVVDVF